MATGGLRPRGHRATHNPRSGGSTEHTPRVSAASRLRFHARRSPPCTLSASPTDCWSVPLRATAHPPWQRRPAPPHRSDTQRRASVGSVRPRVRPLPHAPFGDPLHDSEQARSLIPPEDSARPADSCRPSAFLPLLDPTAAPAPLPLARSRVLGRSARPPTPSPPRGPPPGAASFRGVPGGQRLAGPSSGTTSSGGSGAGGLIPFLARRQGQRAPTAGA